MVLEQALLVAVMPGCSASRHRRRQHRMSLGANEQRDWSAFTLAAILLGDLRFQEMSAERGEQRRKDRHKDKETETEKGFVVCLRPISHIKRTLKFASVMTS